MRSLLAQGVACLVLGMVVLGAPSIEAQVVPFKASGRDNIYLPATGEYFGTGKATHMGRCLVNGTAISTPTANPLVLDWSGGGPLTAANGDQIFFAGGGQVELIPLGGTMFAAVWTGHFEITGGTGRFADVGPGPQPVSVIAVNHPFDIASDPEWPFDWQIEGQINLGRR